MINTLLPLIFVDRIRACACAAVGQLKQPKAAGQGDNGAVEYVTQFHRYTVGKVHSRELYQKPGKISWVRRDEGKAALNYIA